MRGLLLLSSSLALIACGSQTTYTVSGRTLTVLETNFGLADYYCNTLAQDEVMVVMSDFALCGEVHAGKASREIFHSTDETNLRIVFPADGWLRVPPTTTFTVGKSDCSSGNAPGTQATAWFSHAPLGMADYDVNVNATSGTVSVTYPTGYPKETQLSGSFDMMFGSDHVAGSFAAGFCSGTPGIAPGFGS